MQKCHATETHEIAPKEQARSCNDRHSGGIDLTKRGYSGDPLGGK